MAKFVDMKLNYLADDKDGKLVFLADSAWSLQMAQEQYPKIEFHFKSEF